jgi:hypothetical protein
MCTTAYLLTDRHTQDFILLIKSFRITQGCRNIENSIAVRAGAYEFTKETSNETVIFEGHPLTHQTCSWWNKHGGLDNITTPAFLSA